ncbi:MAG: hypothetical protein LQ348_006997 [Seirophora lacunosa]|nr:MAG: hypothetical protein LQ348_006997 [Seirophora lacunosa]
MTSSPTSPSALLDFLRASYPSAVSSSASETDLPALSHQVFPNTSYTDSEKVEISQWLTTSSRLATPDEDEAKHAERLGSLNIHLSTRTTLLGSKPSVADIALYYRLAPAVKSWSAEERTGKHGYHHIVRFIDFVQNAPFLGLSISDDNKVDIDLNDVKFVRKPLDPKEEKERKKKEKAAAAANGETVLAVGKDKGEDTSKSSNKEQARDAAAKAEDKVKGAVTGESTQQPKKEKKEKQPKPQKQPAKETPLSPCLIDLRVGHILKAENHPNADSLYVSTIACGDAPGTDNTSEYEGQVVRTVCSGLNGLVPLEEMQGRKIVAVCNLKPVTMRGIKSAAMVLAASPRLKEGEEDNHKGPVELVTPPADAKAGERVMFEGWTGEPEGVLNPKKKVWETLQPGFTTTTGLEVGFDMGAVPQLHGDEGAQKPVGKLVTASGGNCTVKSLGNAVVR